MVDSVTGLILAGGRATRMGGKDKGLLDVAGRPLVRHIVDQLVLQVEHILINANRNLPEYEELGYPVISDQLEDYQGPLAGMLSGLDNCRTEWILTAPCDGPFVDDHYAANMMQAALRGSFPLAVASGENRLQPVYCLLHRSLSRSLTHYLESGQRKIDRWFASQQHAIVTFDGEPSMFTNINTPEELAHIHQTHFPVL